MNPEQQFRIIPAREVAEHIAAIDCKYHSLIRSIAVLRKMRYVVGLQPSQFKWLYNLSIIPHLFKKGYTIKEQLSYEPEVETRNRKPLREPSQTGATWELRLGTDNEFRIFYQTVSDTREVNILVVAVKIGNQLFVSGKEFEL